jgi:hypothetical protein
MLLADTQKKAVEHCRMTRLNSVKTPSCSSSIVNSPHMWLKKSSLWEPSFARSLRLAPRAQQHAGLGRDAVKATHLLPNRSSDVKGASAVALARVRAAGWDLLLSQGEAWWMNRGLAGCWA